MDNLFLDAFELSTEGFTIGLPRDIYYHEDDCDFLNPKIFKGENAPADWIQYSLCISVKSDRVIIQYYGQNGKTLSPDELKEIIDDQLWFLEEEH